MHASRGLQANVSANHSCCRHPKRIRPQKSKVRVFKPARDDGRPDEEGGGGRPYRDMQMHVVRDPEGESVEHHVTKCATTSRSDQADDDAPQEIHALGTRRYTAASQSHPIESCSVHGGKVQRCAHTRRERSSSCRRTGLSA